MAILDVAGLDSIDVIRRPRRATSPISDLPFASGLFLSLSLSVCVCACVCMCVGNDWHSCMLFVSVGRHKRINFNPGANGTHVHARRSSCSETLSVRERVRVPLHTCEYAIEKKEREKNVKTKKSRKKEKGKWRKLLRELRRVLDRRGGNRG